MENLTDNMKTWASNNEPATPEELEKLEMLTEDVDRILEQRRKDEENFWANVPAQISDDAEPKVPMGCKVTAILIVLSILGVGALGAWKTIEIILSWI